MIIYKKYNQEQLNLQYNNRFHVPGFENSLQLWENLSRLAEKKYKVIKDIAYGYNPRECLDIFPSDKPGSKTLVFIHGGYWQKFEKSNFHFIAGAFADYGITTVVINYPLAPAVSIDQIVESCRTAVDWLYNNIVQWNGDPDQMYITGNSAGAHLAAMLMTKNKTRTDQVCIKGVCAISGLFNLEPIQLSNINDVLQMDNEMVMRNSPVLMQPLEFCPLMIAAGAEETNEFLDQSRELNNKWKNKINSVEFLEIPGLNHFSILDSIVKKNSVLHQSIIKLLKI